MKLSVSVIQFTSSAHLERCLEALAQQHGDVAEVIVPHDDTFGGVATLQRRFPDVRFVHVAGRRMPAELRSVAALAAQGGIMAFLEDHCVPAPDWAQRVLAAHAAPHAAVGGAVEKGFPPGRRRDSALNWALYLADYSRYMNPQPAGPRPSLTDCNVSYKRAALEEIADAWRDEFHENIVNERFAQQGAVLWLAPDVVVHEQRTLDLSTAMRDRFEFGRLFGSTRSASLSPARRLLFAAATLAMPPVLIARIAATLLRKRRHGAPFLVALPALLVVTTTWLLGECVGYLTGAPSAATAPVAAAAVVGGRGA